MDRNGSKYRHDNTRSSATTEIADIQGHSRSFGVVPIDAAYMTSY